MNVELESQHGTTEEPMAPRVYLFEDAFRAFAGDSDDVSDRVMDAMRRVLGGKGAALARMAGSGFPVPPGMTIITDCCQAYHENGDTLPIGLMEEVLRALRAVELRLGRSFGDDSNPLLVSVRSGAKNSMPGMMDTILNLGLNDDTVIGLAQISNDERFAWDCYRRLVEMYGTIVLGMSAGSFEQIIEDVKPGEFGKAPNLTVSELKQVVGAFKKLVLAQTGSVFPTDVHEQLEGAIAAVFKSWNNDRAVFYRKINNIEDDAGTAVTVQAMVFGNLGEDCATGVAFTREFNTGEAGLYGDFLINAQGEDVVNGSRNTMTLSEMETLMPEAYGELKRHATRLERLYGDMQDIEFTVERGQFWALQTRTGKRSAAAAVRIAVELANDGLISRAQALLRVDPSQIEKLLLPSFDATIKAAASKQGLFLAKGLAASPGAATGMIVFDPDDAASRGIAGEHVILCRVETCPDDIHGMHHARGVVTTRGGMTSHAAVVARGMGKPCVVGCAELQVDIKNETVTVGSHVLKKGDVLSIDGSTGEIFLGELQTRDPVLSPEFHEFMGWADTHSLLRVRANADTPEDALIALEFGAQGIGLCRTEHMFMDPTRLPVMRRMIMAGNESERKAVLAELLPMQREDFIGIFKAMNGLPVTIRLLDPPLHEFLPDLVALSVEVAVLKATNSQDIAALAEKETYLAKVRELHEKNPMMGLRGCRLGLRYPEINIMQVTAIFEAAVAVTKEGGTVAPEIMIPLVGHENELQVAREVLEEVAQAVMERAGIAIAYQFGTMIEVPRAALIAGSLAKVSEFFSFGTNDLTQMTFGYSRDDAEGSIVKPYMDGVVGKGGAIRQILSVNPFAVLDRDGVGALIRMAVESGQQTRPNIKLGICGEHGGDPASIAFATEVGLSYVSASPYRVPVARLAAAQAQIAIQSTWAEDAFNRR